jgi:hypothetical protein
LQIRIILWGPNRGQLRQAIIWLMVGAFQRPGGPVNGKNVRRAAGIGHRANYHSIYPRKDTGTRGLPVFFLCHSLQKKILA